MRALTLTQPWASLVAHGLKRWETRSWRDSYTGPLAIHAAKGMPVEATEFYYEEVAELLEPWYGDISDLERGSIIAVAWLAGYERTEQARYQAGADLDYGDFSRGRWAWELQDVRLLPEPIPCRGMLGLWEAPDDPRLIAIGREMVDTRRQQQIAAGQSEMFR